MRVSYQQISTALTTALEARGYSGARIMLMPVESPRPWGVSTNACFLLGKQAAAAEIEAATEGLSKKETKQKAGELARLAGEQLAAGVSLELNEQIQPLPFIERIEAEGAYINFYYDSAALTAHVVSSVLDETLQFGKGEPTGKRIMVEYAQPNTHKDFHVGHLRNASIGQAIANLLEFEGNEVLKATYIGDVGAHVAKAVWGHNHRSDDEWLEFYPRSNELAESADKLLYWGTCYQETEKLLSQANRDVDVDSATPEALVRALAPAKIKAEMGKWLQAWESGNLQARVEWQQSRDLCVSAFRDVFNELHIDIDSDYWFYESTVDDSKLGQKTAAELKSLGIAVIDDTAEYKGALYVDFEKQSESLKPDGTPVFRDDERKKNKKLGKMTILRSDQTSLYQTKELGLAKYKFDNFEIDESLYVVGAEQKLYFEQVFAILRLWGFPNAQNCHHIDYALVVLPEGKMSSRGGTIVSYRELRDESLSRARKITTEKAVAGNIERTAQDIAIAAIKFAMLKVTANQQIVFDFEEALSFSGRAAPYLQYAYARAGKLVGAESAAISRGAGVPARHGVPQQIEDFQQYKHRLPHWRLSGSVYFVTWRINPKQHELSDKERYLVSSAIRFFEDDRYVLFAFVVMNDHVHVLVRPENEYNLESILHSWKSFTANKIQKEFGRSGAIWQDEYMDRIIRDEDELYETTQYILNNPAKRWPERDSYSWLYLNMAGRDARPTGEMDHSPGYSLHDSEIELARQLSLFPQTCRDAADKQEPATICTYLYNLANVFSAFYRDCRVLDAAEPERGFRTLLTTAFRRVLKTGFELLALPLPEEM